MTATTKTRGKPAPREVDEVMTIYLPASTYERVQAFADANLISVAEAIREFMAAFAKGKTTVRRKRSTRRVNLWMARSEWNAFSKARKAQKVTIAEAIEAAMGDDA